MPSATFSHFGGIRIGFWYALPAFSRCLLYDARVPLDSNASERSVRRVALGRKNHHFVGDVEAG